MKVELSVSNQEENSESDSSVPLPDIPCYEEVFRDELLLSFPVLSGCSVVEVSIIMVSMEKMQDFNRNYRDLDEATDVLSFPLWEREGKFEPPEGWDIFPLGDIIVCPELVSKTGSISETEGNISMETILCHGFLHLTGWDHADPEEKREMWKKQNTMSEKIRECTKGHSTSENTDREVL